MLLTSFPQPRPCQYLTGNRVSVSSYNAVAYHSTSGIRTWHVLQSVPRPALVCPVSSPVLVPDQISTAGPYRFFQFGPSYERRRGIRHVDMCCTYNESGGKTFISCFCQLLSRRICCTVPMSVPTSLSALCLLGAGSANCHICVRVYEHPFLRGNAEDVC